VVSPLPKICATFGFNSVEPYAERAVHSPLFYNCSGFTVLLLPLRTS
jgi:hypothetical protein